MKKNYLLLFLLSFAFCLFSPLSWLSLRQLAEERGVGWGEAHAQTSVPPGSVYGTCLQAKKLYGRQAWSLSGCVCRQAGSPYLIQGSIQIPNNSILTFHQETSVNFHMHKRQSLKKYIYI